MSHEKMLPDLENGREIAVEKMGHQGSRFLKLSCTIAVLAFVSVSFYLLFCQIGPPDANRLKADDCLHFISLRVNLGLAWGWWEFLANFSARRPRYAEFAPVVAPNSEDTRLPRLLPATRILKLHSECLISKSVCYLLQKAAVRGAEDLSANSGLHHLRKQVGNDPRGRIAAHLTADPIKGESDELTWQEESGIAFSSGIEFSNNSLLIKKTGFYFIYTQVVFYYSQCEESTIFLSHDMHKLSLAYPEETILLKATKSVCHHGHHDDPWYKTSYQGAIFDFEAGDRIFSRVPANVAKYLDKTEGKTFFGIFAL
ncbi:tumor necrosis factor-like [Carcharodon carcharias]|uniref:tumor necrosis factor-like n=1 Tax=Carcharodon carcharias TaxID=13397 RepID=UPI001B7EDC73|nr:tumor necrosis factor-like [Carcharodon carcharias]